ncbi:MAG: YjgN family protein [Methylomonas sp.]|jgi:uncharacterized membrane protein YjgN (DUF898 family)
MHEKQQFHFSGTGNEYFRIWIVNVFFSIVTLGIYSAWAKVRRNQYFYRHTLLAGSSFDYHGDPKVILKGRVFAVVIFAGYSALQKFNPTVAGLFFLLIILIMPWLLVRSFRFRLYNSSYRGIRMGFHGRTGAAYINWLLYPALSLFTLGALMPLVQKLNTGYIRNNASYGNTFFTFTGKAGGFFRIWLGLFLYLIALFLAAGIVLGVLTSTAALPQINLKDSNALSSFLLHHGYILPMLFLFALSAYLFFKTYIFVSLQNLIWNNTHLAELGFSSTLKIREMFFITLTNLVLIVVTLGLYKPFADIRLARYRIERLNLLAATDIERFMQGAQVSATAVGEEVSDIFDMDIAF